MIEDMQLAGLSAKTQEVYLQAVTALVKHYGNRSPDQLTEEEIRCYLLAVRQSNARGTFKTCHTIRSERRTRFSIAIRTALTISRLQKL